MYNVLDICDMTYSACRYALSRSCCPEGRSSTVDTYTDMYEISAAATTAIVVVIYVVPLCDCSQLRSQLLLLLSGQEESSCICCEPCRLHRRLLPWHMHVTLQMTSAAIGAAATMATKARVRPRDLCMERELSRVATATAAASIDGLGHTHVCSCCSCS